MYFVSKFYSRACLSVVSLDSEYVFYCQFNPTNYQPKPHSGMFLKFGDTFKHYTTIVTSLNIAKCSYKLFFFWCTTSFMLLILIYWDGGST
jgi:hypothetical protein